MKFQKAKTIMRQFEAATEILNHAAAEVEEAKADEAKALERIAEIEKSIEANLAERAQCEETIKKAQAKSQMHLTTVLSLRDKVGVVRMDAATRQKNIEMKEKILAGARAKLKSMDADVQEAQAKLEEIARREAEAKAAQTPAAEVK